MGLPRIPPPKGPPPKTTAQSKEEVNVDDNDEEEEDDDEEEEEDEDSDIDDSNDESSSDDLNDPKTKANTKSNSQRVFEQPVAKETVQSIQGKSPNSSLDSKTTQQSTVLINVSSASEEELRKDHIEQLQTLRDHARMLEKLDDIQAAEVLYERALELDPTDIQTLTNIAVFLHHKKGELTRAEAFFNRALQLCLPGLHFQLQSPSRLKQANSYEEKSTPQPDLLTLVGKEDKYKLQHIVNLLLAYASFLEKAKGDAEAASELLQRAVKLAPDHASALATFAHFFTLHREVCKSITSQDPDAMFQKALRLDPKNVNYMMWYGKFLKKRKQLGPAELMYRSALEVSKGDQKLEPAAICNYATFLFKHRKNTEKAREMFEEALERYMFPLIMLKLLVEVNYCFDSFDRFLDHKGLRKNYAQVLKLLNKDNCSESLLEGKLKSRHAATPVQVRSDAQTASRGSKRAHRIVNSITKDIPTHLETSESRSNFILSQLNQSMNIHDSQYNNANDQSHDGEVVRNLNFSLAEAEPHQQDISSIPPLEYTEDDDASDFEVINEALLLRRTSSMNGLEDDEEIKD
jgi:Tfp pilus assembly protein PilF